VAKDTPASTSTDSQGNYTITLPDNARTLVYTLLGFETTAQPVGNEDVLNISLKASLTGLDEVVVVGYGTQKRASVTAAISSVPMDEILDMPVSNVATALQGKIPGVVIQQNNGAPG